MTALTVSGPDEAPRLRDWPGRPADRFQLRDLHPGAGYRACLATLDGPPGEVTELDGSGVLARAYG